MSPRSKEQNEEIRNRRKQEILAAAVRVYVDKGYAASDMGDIADRAGLAHGLVYYYFKSKKQLFRELYEYMMEQSNRFTRSYFENDGPAIEMFKGYARIVCEGVLGEPAIPRFYARIGLDLPQLYTPEELSPFAWVKQFMHPMVEAIEKGIRQGSVQQGDAGLMAMQFWGSVSQGMHYLDEMQQQLVAEGIPEAERKKRLERVVDQVVESSVSLFEAR